MGGGGGTGSRPTSLPQTPSVKISEISPAGVYIYCNSGVSTEDQLGLRNASFRPSPVAHFPVALFVVCVCALYGSTRRWRQQQQPQQQRVAKSGFLHVFTLCSENLGRRRRTGAKTSGMRVTAGIRGTGGPRDLAGFSEKETLKCAKPVGLPTKTSPLWAVLGLHKKGKVLRQLLAAAAPSDGREAVKTNQISDTSPFQRCSFNSLFHFKKEERKAGPAACQIALTSQLLDA